MVVSIILARGGSKAIPHKNLVDFCGKPLLYWSVSQSLECKEIESTWVSSDDPEILSYSEKIGARCIVRPPDISDDFATSESGWLHAITQIEKEKGPIDLVLAPQATSPVREAHDFTGAFKVFRNENLDSLFASSPAGDLFMWHHNKEGNLTSLNYDYLNRKRKQDVASQMIENGSFYIFKSELLRKIGNRLGGKIGTYSMEFWKAFEIDDYETKRLCEALMYEFLVPRATENRNHD